MKYNTKNFSFSLVTTPKKIRKINIFLLWFFLVTLIILFLPWTQNFEMKGTLTSLNPADRPQSVNSTIAGRIEKWFVLEGQSVKKGDTILFLSEIKDKYFDPNFLSRIKDQINAKENALGSTKQKSIALQKQIQALNDGLKFSINKAKNKLQQAKLKVQSDSIDFIAAQTNYKIAKQQFDRQIKLYEMDLKSKVELETRELKFQEAQAKLLSAENKFFNAKNDMVNAFIELNSIEAEYLDKISKSESDLNSTLAYMFDTEGTISKMNNDFANMQIRNSFYYITAPQDGMIVKALRTGIGETIKEGDEVVTIMPENPELAVEMYASAIDVAILNVNDEIRLQFEGWPALVFSGWPGVTFGTFGAKVKTIDKVSTGGKFRILATVDTEAGHWPKQIRIGTNAKGWAMLKTVPVWFEIWRRLNSFPPEFRNDMPQEKKLDQKKQKTSTSEEKDEKDEK